MKSRFNSLVNVHKNRVQSGERAVQQAHNNLKNAERALSESLSELEKIEMPLHGRVDLFLSNRALLQAQRAQIKHNEEWVLFAKNELENKKAELRKEMREYEKFNYLKHKEIEEKLKTLKQQEAKNLDEIALISHARKNKSRSL